MAAVLSATFFLLDYRLLLWRRRGKEVEGDRIWKNLRLFSGWMCAGCVAGVITFSLFLQWRSFEYATLSPGITHRQFYELQAALHRCFSAFNIFYPVHLLCVIFAMSTLLRRVSDHASHPYYNTARDNVSDGRGSSHTRFDCRDYFGQYALYYWVRSLHLLALLFCALNIAARAVAAGFTAQAAALLERAAAATGPGGEETDISLEIFQNSFRDSERNYNTCIAAARVVEAAVLLLMLSGFLLFFPAVIVMFCRIERKMDGLLQEMHLRTDNGTAFLPFEFSPRAADGAETQTQMPICNVRLYLADIKSSATAQTRRFEFCLALVLIALAALAANAVFVAVAFVDTSRSFDCDRCAPCQSIRYVMLTWLVFTPEWFPLNASLGATLPLLFSLYLMTTPEDRLLLLHPGRFLTEEITVHPTETSREARLRTERARLGINLQ